MNLIRKIIIIGLIFSSGTFSPSSYAITIPPDAKNIVTFIFIKNEEGDLVPNGTGFFVGVKNESLDQFSNVYLVTAKHVLTAPEGGYFRSFYIRLNTRAGGAEFIEIPTVFNNKNMIFTHPDPTVDIACIPFLPDKYRYDFKYLPDSYLTTKEIFIKNHIQEGDEVFFTGLFIAHIGQSKNYPIVRFGKVAMITDEKVYWDGSLMDLYLIEAQSFEGNSGSPVFFYLENNRGQVSSETGNKVLFAGIIQGNFSKGSMVKMDQSEDVSFSVDNIGISAVVPAGKLYELLYSRQLLDQRENTVNNLPISR